MVIFNSYVSLAEGSREGLAGTYLYTQDTHIRKIRDSAEVIRWKTFLRDCPQLAIKSQNELIPLLIVFSSIYNIIIYIYNNNNNIVLYYWLVVYLLLWKIWLRQLGWLFHSQLNGKSFKIPWFQSPWDHQCPQDAMMNHPELGLQDYPIYEMENKTCFKPPTRYSIGF